MEISKSYYTFSIAVIGGFLVIISLMFDQPATLIANNFIIIPIAFVAAAFANATAVGGGFLFLPLFVFGYSLSPLAALKLSLATQAFGMTSGALGWSKQFIENRAFFIGGFASLIGMWAGTYGLNFDPADIKLLFGWVSIAIFIAIMLEIRFGGVAKRTSIDAINDYRIVGYILVTFFGGIVTAWTAIGVGEIVALYLLFVYKVRIETAIGTGVAVLAVSSIAGLYMHIDLGGIRWDLLVFTIPGVLLGGFFGARFGLYIEQKLFHPRLNREEPVDKSSPLKWLFSVIILVNSVAILMNAYLYS